MAAVAKSDGGIVKVGTTGTIGSLMIRELEFMKHMPPASEACRRKTQIAPVSVPSGAGPKKIQPRRNPSNESGSSSNSVNGNINHKNIGDVQKPRYTTQKTGHKVPMLRSESINVDKNASRENWKERVILHCAGCRSEVQQSYEQPTQEARVLQAF